MCSRTIQLWTLMFFAAVLGLSLMVADRWLGAPILALQQFGPSLTMFLLALCSVTSLSRFASRPPASSC